ncbi:MAG: 4a-hydroxytetrahydrobiopterin dehydratase [Nitrincola sp.]|nr:4a-hydroxytetrahydrobiopterin dehydratase [Nitrincola sp.]
MEILSGKEACNFCRADAEKLTHEQMRQELAVIPDWQVIEVDSTTRLTRRFNFADFKQALVFTNKVGEFAETIGHHPDLLTTWGSVTVTWYTHKIGGVQQGDFMCAIETELIYAKLAMN